MMSRSSSNSPAIQQSTQVAAAKSAKVTKSNRRLSLSASAATAATSRRARMPSAHSQASRMAVLAAVFLLVAGLLPHLASSAPTPQDDEFNAAAGQDAAAVDTAGGSDEPDALAADQDVGQDGPDRNGATAAELSFAINQAINTLLPTYDDGNNERVPIFNSLSPLINKNFSPLPTPPPVLTLSSPITYTLLNRSKTPMIFSPVSFSQPSSQRPVPAGIINLRQSTVTPTTTTLKPFAEVNTIRLIPYRPIVTSRPSFFSNFAIRNANVTLLEESTTKPVTATNDYNYDYYEDETESNNETSTETSSRAPSTSTLSATVVNRTAVSQLPIFLIKQEDPVVAVPTTTTTTTQLPIPYPSTPPPNVGVLNGLTRAGGAGIGIGLISAIYASVAIFFGRRRRRSITDREYWYRDVGSDFDPEVNDYHWLHDHN